MKQLLILATMLAIALASVVGVFAGDGAVKTEFDPNVGWVILNTTASGKLNATAHLDNAAPNEEFTVSVRIRYEDGTVVPFADIGTLSTNGQGKGNAQVQMDIDPSAGSKTLRRVAFRVRQTGPSGFLYLAVAWDVPLK